MESLSLLAIFMSGFLSGGHCVGMCGGLSSAFVLQIPKHMKRLPMIFLLNFGRIFSYVVIGVLLGALTQFAIGLQQDRTLQLGLFAIANGLLILMGLYLAGFSHGIQKLEIIGKPIWKKLNPILGKFLPIRSYSGSLMAGVLWGWLPCGLVYTASTYALTSGSALQGGLIMLAFGLGTLPNLLMIGFLASSIKRFFQHKMVRIVAGLMVIAIAVVQLILVFK